jgi:squalene-hopene/tetraprenyl-beta-curcumene cyclase
LPGGVPDADDTPGALLALRALNGGKGDQEAVGLGVEWLLGLQNRDGGWPTFCRGWGRLPFDRSGTDLTAHVLRALHAWAGQAEELVQDGYLFSPDLDYLVARRAMGQVGARIRRGLAYLARQQRADGSWLPLWFGNQHAPNDENPIYGTARVLAAYRDLHIMESEPARRAVAWLVSAQNPDGGWGAGQGTPSSVEETALAVEVLLDVGEIAANPVASGLTWLVRRVESGGLEEPSPIGFYFAKLWYSERLYPVIFTVAALGRARRLPSGRPGVHPEHTYPTRNP